MSVKLTKSGPGLPGLKVTLDQLKKAEVLVGIPAEKALRKGDAMNNASLMFILEKGSELRGIPATPIIKPGVEKARSAFTPHLKTGAAAILDKNPEKALQELEIAGTIAANGVKRYFTDPDNGWPPNAPSTIAAKGSDRRNIDTGALRGAVASVVRFKK